MLIEAYELGVEDGLAKLREVFAVVKLAGTQLADPRREMVELKRRIAG